MLKLPILEFFLRGIPEGFLYMLACYAVSGMAIKGGRYIISSLLHAIAVYLIRLLPISFGVHTILSIAIFILLTVFINKTPLIKSITAALITFIIALVSETINYLLIDKVFKLDINSVFADSIMKTVMGMPSLMISGSIIGTYYFVLWRKKKLVLNTNTTKL